MKRNVRSATASTSASCGGHESGKQTFRTSSPRRERRGAHSAAQTSTRRMARAPHRRDGIGVGLMGPPGSFGRGRARLAVSAALRCSLALSPFPDHRQPSSPPAFYIPPTGPSLSFLPPPLRSSRSPLSLSASSPAMLPPTLFAAVLPLLAAVLAQEEGQLSGPTTSAAAAGYSCDPNSCKLPNCHCASTDPPGGLSPVSLSPDLSWCDARTRPPYTNCCAARSRLSLVH